MKIDYIKSFWWILKGMLTKVEVTLLKCVQGNCCIVRLLGKVHVLDAELNFIGIEKESKASIGHVQQTAYHVACAPHANIFDRVSLFIMHNISVISIESNRKFI